MAGMFSEEDMRELSQIFPRSSNSALVQAAPNLISASAGDGFINLDAVSKELDGIIGTSVESRISIPALASRLEVGNHVIYSLLGSSGANFLLGKDSKYLIPKSEADRLQRDLKRAVRGNALQAADFADANNIALESIPTLVSMNQFGSPKGQKDNDTPSLALYPSTALPERLESAIIYSPFFLKECVSRAQSAFEKAQAPDGLGIDSIPRDGSYPDAFLGLIVRQLGPDLNGKFAFQDGKLWFTATSYLEQQREEKLKGLIKGTIPKVELQWFTELLPNQHPDAGSAERFIRDAHGNDVLFFFDTVVSKEWYNSVVKAKLGELKMSQIIDTSGPFYDLSPVAAHEAAGKAHGDILTAVRQEGFATVAEGIFPYLIPCDLFDRIQANFADRVRYHAKYLWENSDHLPEAELTLDIPSVLQGPAAEHGLPGPLFQILLGCGLDGGAKSVFNTTLTHLESEAEIQFSQFWQDRVIIRFELYNAGARAITDVKLRTQLQHLLRDYVIKELVPDTTSRAESRGLVRSSRMKRNIKKLHVALRDEAKDIQAVHVSLQKFASKLDMTFFEAAGPNARKETHVLDMVRGMQKDTDGPRLFLTCVVVLLARRQEGVVYATGKFAPKLLKVLKNDGLEDGVVKKLEELKEVVKAGKVGEPERATMRDLAKWSKEC